MFATFKNGNWHIVGFYQNARYAPDGCPGDHRIIDRKIDDLLFLKDRKSLGVEWLQPKSKMEKLLKSELTVLKYRVYARDVTVLSSEVDVSAEIALPKNNRITTCTSLNEETFFKILTLCKTSVVKIRGDLTDDEKRTKAKRTPLEFEDEDEEEFSEGRLKYRTHRVRERQQAIVDAAKRKFKENHKRLFCECCTFDFSKEYKGVGENFIEAHHLVPVSELPADGSGVTKIEDLVMLCSNCHRMAHRASTGLKLHELKSLLKNKVYRSG